MRDAGVNLLFLSGNAVCWVTPLRASHATAGPNRIMFRGGPYGGDNEYAEQPREGARPVPRARPRRGLADGRAQRRAGQRRRRLGRARSPITGSSTGPGMKKGDRIPGLIGWEYHGDPPADIPGLEVVAEGTAWSGA